MESSQRLADTESQIERLSKIIASLRGENGCPWDRQQTPRSITVYLVEEVYELIEAIHDDEAGAVREELGDVLFQLLFVADVYRERGLF
ncbi:MAG: MazG nucleotide pyrophosphohydrolase domain-containing protein, partial [Desulfosudaceae bacterium]